MNVKIRYVDMSGSAGPANLASVITENTKLVMIESPTNPMQRILNIPDICRVAHSKVGPGGGGAGGAVLVCACTFHATLQDFLAIFVPPIFSAVRVGSFDCFRSTQLSAWLWLRNYSRGTNRRQCLIRQS